MTSALLVDPAAPAKSPSSSHLPERLPCDGAGEGPALLEELGILAETTGRESGRTSSYAKYLDRLRVKTKLE